MQCAGDAMARGLRSSTEPLESCASSGCAGQPHCFPHCIGACLQSFAWSNIAWLKLYRYLRGTMLKHTLLVICTFLASSCNCAAFLQSTATRQAEASAGKCHRPSLLKVASTSSIVASLDGINTKDASDELISLLIKRRCGRRNEYDEERISSLVDTLTSARARFDPTICLDGPLFVSNVVEGPPPLWERFGLEFGGSNDGEKKMLETFRDSNMFTVTTKRALSTMLR